MNTIDITPSWSGIMPLLVDMLISETVAEDTKKEIAAHLKDLAEEVDKINGSYCLKPANDLLEN